MWRKIGRAFGIMMGWGVIVAYIVYASHLAHEHRSLQRVEKVFISLPDSSDTQRFTSSEQILRLLEQEGVPMKGALVDSIDAVKIGDIIAKESYVRDVDVYVTYTGELYIDVRQHKPILRMLCGGLNSYVTADGVVFRSPKGSSCYVPVVTGKYTPQFACDYEGRASNYYGSIIESEAERGRAIANELSELHRKQEECAEYISESSKTEAEKYKEKLSVLNLQEEQLITKQRASDERKKKLEKKSEDFANLTNFVARVSADAFWASEIVQIVADTTCMGEISLRLVPRSGNFVIEFGTLGRSDAKLAKLRNFYDKGLSYMGWDRYKIVDIRYDKQIICTE